ncbi:tetratricopeptide repeat protein [Acidobacteriia bacterium AH_259_A11_L15]|nr:tetratricopeptide repeat protein [Acidobacteriia bacterium AH_259_A11_L15]
MTEQAKKAEADNAFQQGMMFFRSSYYGKAVTTLQRAVELDRHNSLYVSYLGLLVALAHKKYAEAEQICHTALRMKRNQVQSYLNLAEVYLKAGNKEDAVETLTVGLQYTKRDVRLTRALRKLGVRRPPIIPFLQRKHFLNRHLGKLRHRVLQRLGIE